MVTADQVRAARREGFAAGYALATPSPNPYAPVHVPAWRQPRTAAGRAELAERERAARILARVWRVGYRAGVAAYRSDRGQAG